MGLTVLFTHLKIILLQCFSVFNFIFQFSTASKWTPSIKDEHGLRKTTKKKKKRGRGSTLDVQVIWAYTPSLSVDPKCKRERERERER